MLANRAAALALIAALALPACEEHATGERKGPFATPQEACRSWGERTEALWSPSEDFADCIGYGYGGGTKIAEYRRGDDGRWYLTAEYGGTTPLEPS